jgi:hypothetical protein
MTTSPANHPGSPGDAGEQSLFHFAVPHPPGGDQPEADGSHSGGPALAKRPRTHMSALIVVAIVLAIAVIVPMVFAWASLQQHLGAALICLARRRVDVLHATLRTKPRISRNRRTNPASQLDKTHRDTPLGAACAAPEGRPGDGQLGDGATLRLGDPAQRLHQSQVVPLVNRGLWNGGRPGGRR